MMPKTADRYFLQQEAQNFWSISDRHIVGIEPEHRMVRCLDAAHAADLLKKLNTASTGVPQ
jgi:hypothetical protein